jgi:hypothetical protein
LDVATEDIEAALLEKLEQQGGDQGFADAPFALHDEMTE